MPTVVAAIEINKLYTIGLFEGESNMSLYIDGIHIVDIYEDLAEGDSIYLDENGILHVYEFIEDLDTPAYEVTYGGNNEELTTTGLDFIYTEADENATISNVNVTYDSNNENLIIGDDNQ